MSDDNLPFIQSVAFATGAIQICFLEQRDSGGASTLEKTLTIPVEVVADELFSEMVDAIQQFLEEALRAHERSPVDQFRSPR
jgi:hypothetical protein